MIEQLSQSHQPWQLDSIIDMRRYDAAVMSSEIAELAAKWNALAQGRVTLRDYLRVFRRYRVAIVLIAAIGAAAGVLEAKRQPRVYQATAAVAFQDPAQELTLVGLGPGSECRRQLCSRHRMLKR